MPTVWLIVIVAGPLLLLAFIAFSRLSNRKHETRQSEMRADRGARHLRERIEEDREKPH
ncbi:hypothetical protein RM533_11670 [Croceicoccus sp. F390]|uniref:Uncharacterized protein n=1 Tax=Croceicoccus esteveae TaxID=3075597 RepID=A0ABU2ZKT5_9SPHN|nr:hypothetical protein [Croceicoccus sp. F390]MDT0576831.1 hypothetical protein [Croceicoccus sp. F390]